MSAWIIIVLTTATLLTLYLGWRLVEPLNIPRQAKLLGWGMLFVLLFGQRLSWFLRRGQDSPAWLNSVDWIGYVFLGLISFLMVFMLLRDLPLAALRTAGLFSRPFRKKRTSPDPTRRRFLLNASNAAMLATAAPLSALSVYQARKEPEVSRVNLEIPGLPAGLDGFAIAQISDTHIGPTIRADWARMVVDRVNALSPDMVVHTGDMVDGTVAELRNSVAPFADLKARHGVWFCTGNHEYYSGVRQWLPHVRWLGMTPLVNEHALVDTGNGRILLAGVSDYSSRRIDPAHVSSPARAMQAAPDHDVSILLAHQPRSVFEAEEAGFDVQLSGHTHGGQFFPWTYAVHWFQPYVRGLHRVGGTLLYVNVGTGYWGPPMRLGTSPEITLHVLRCIREKA